MGRAERVMAVLEMVAYGQNTMSVVGPFASKEEAECWFKGLPKTTQDSIYVFKTRTCMAPDDARKEL